MTKNNFIFCILTDWFEENKIERSFEQQQSLTKELCKHLMMKKIKHSYKKGLSSEKGGINNVPSTT